MLTTELARGGRGECLSAEASGFGTCHQLWREGGVGSLASRGPSGSRCRLSPCCLEKLAAYLEQGPAAHGWVEDQVWTAARVAMLIGRKFHFEDEAGSPAVRPEDAPGAGEAARRS